MLAILGRGDLRVGVREDRWLVGRGEGGTLVVALSSAGEEIRSARRAELLVWEARGWPPDLF